ncbi:hypothetical protein ACF09I_34405 [Streptomyces sp. NPDC014940]|uniref:hypothetical protein n=1 Tax=Streptomyces sp. NPDC014940 TaxID=3364932 RepID=UPI0036FA14F9
MAEWNIALGALVLILALAAGALLSRWYFTPAAEPTATLAELMRPGTANDIGWCPAEQAERLHSYDAAGRCCWTCRTFTPKGAGL